MIRHRVSLSLALALPLATSVAFATAPRADRTDSAVRIGSKDFAESRLLAEVFAETVEARGVRVVRRFGLAGSELAFRALAAGEIDVYPEYTGTGLVTLLHEPPARDPRAVLERVRAVFAARFGLSWLPSLGFENGWVLAVPRALADRERLATISDLVRVAPALRGVFSPEFVPREDGLVGLSRAYGLRLREVRSAGQAVRYQAIASGAADVIDAYSTDGRLDALGLAALADDRRFFPPYEASPLVRGDLGSRSPRALAALLDLAGRIDAPRMRAANAAVEVQGRRIEDVAARLLADLGLARGRAEAAPVTERTSAGAFVWAHRRDVLRHVTRHLLLTLAGLLAAIGIGAPLGAIARGRAGVAVLWGSGVLQTVPALALFALLVPFLGIGAPPAILALFLYALLPIVRGTAVGLESVDPAVLDAALGLGLTARQIFFQARLPLAVPVIMSGVRTAAVITVGNATLAGFVGAGGLGEPILTGITLNDGRLILQGAVPAAVLAVLVDALLALVERRIAPRFR